jgi:hypothetical protein
MSTINDFPNELLLELFLHLPLKSLISSQGVCRRWRHLVPLSDISPSRRALLELYIEIIFSPFFERTRPWTLLNLRPFDRNEYLDALLKQHDYIPEAFRLWILEWPARAAIGAWPGLPCTTEDRGNAVEDVNWLGRTPPQVSVIYCYEGSAERDILPGLLIWSGHNGYTWLLLDQRRSRHQVCDIVTSISAIHEDSNATVYADWIEWQKRLWKEIEPAAEQLSAKRRQWRGRVRLERQPRIPAKAWTSRNDDGT